MIVASTLGKAAALLLTLGPFQFFTSIRSKPPTVHWWTGRVYLLFGVLLAAVQHAHATTCDSLTDLMQDARTEYTLALRDADLASRRENALRAKKALDDAARAAVDCRCVKVHREFVMAATHAAQAHQSEAPKDFADALRQSILSFNNGLNEFRSCVRYGN